MCRDKPGNLLRTQFLHVFRSQIEILGIPLDQQVLILGGSPDDEDVLRCAGFVRILNSNLANDIGRISGDRPDAGKSFSRIDAEQMELPDESFDVVFAHEVLHHCRSPHRALCEMLRVSRRYVLFLEPNDSMVMSLLVKMRLSFPYELLAVIDHEYGSGGVRNSQIPNFIFRWNKTEVSKTVSSCIPERTFSVHAYPYWDFSVPERELAIRRGTYIENILSVLGARRFLSALQFARVVLNRMPVLRRQGNKFFCCVEKGRTLNPWLARQGAEIVFNRQFGCSR
jgi:SAM-dependent methyltransferase